MLRGNRILLRPLKLDDIATINHWRNDLSLIKLTQGIRFPKTLDMDFDWFRSVSSDQSNKSVIFGIEELSTGTFIGIIQVSNIDWISKVGDFGINIGDFSKLGLGYGKEAMKLFFKYLFQELNLRKLCLKVIDFNKNAKQSYAKLGFVEEGTLREHMFFENNYNDVILMALFKEVYAIND